MRSGCWRCIQSRNVLAQSAPPLLRAVDPLEHVPPVPGSFLETRRWQTKEALVCGQDTIEVGDCDVTIVDIEVRL